LTKRKSGKIGSEIFWQIGVFEKKNPLKRGGKILKIYFNLA